MQSDKAAIDEITAQFFDAFTNRNGTVPNVDCLHDLFAPQAVIVKNVNGCPVFYDVSGFIEPRKAILTDGTLADFREAEVSEDTQLFGTIAQRFCRYEKSWTTAEGKKHEGAGVKSIQFIHTSQGWKICSLTWDDEPAPDND